MHCIIGSGPAGTACAQALLKRGVTVLMLDAGLQLEPARTQIVHELSMVAPSAWRPEQVAFLKENMAASASGIPLKLVFGSDFPYREADQHAPTLAAGVGMRPSLALGGFGNVWGAAMLPYLDADLDGWPFRTAELSEHYRAVLKLAGLAGRCDDLEELFPLYCVDPGALQLSRQAQRLLNNLKRGRNELRAAGWRFGVARLAVQAARAPGTAGCVYCGLCMYGCPYGYIYNSAVTVRQMQAQERFTYQGDAIVTLLRESAGGVLIEGYHRRTQEKLSWKASRVYLAAGLIPTTRILLQSQAAYDQPVRVRDSQYFLFPLLLGRRAAGVQAEALHTLSQLFLEIRNPAVNRHTVHLQVYSYNDLIGQALRQKFGRWARPLDFLARRLEERMLIVQGYLHSDDSARIMMALKQGVPGGPAPLQIRAEVNPETRSALKRVVREVLRHTRRLGALPLPPMLQVADPGRSYHNGGSFPMRKQPVGFESDCLGRPYGWQKVHAVDATVFPSIPATTITFSVMANAHRIGWEAGALD
jgi:choline dehydrogenase-like flavoprotein